MKLKYIKNKIQKMVRSSFYRGGNQISYIQAKEMMNVNTGEILLDVRSPQEYKEYHLEKAINIPVYDLEENIEKLFENKNTVIILYCQSGGRSRKAYNILNKMGYNNLYEIQGGLDNI